jgi:phage terminase large subunit
MTLSNLTINLPHLYQARDYQLDFWDAFHGTGRHVGKQYRIFVKVWHRRAGKDMTDWNAAIERVAEEPMTCKYAFPTNDMARANLWESYTNDGMRFTEFVPAPLRLKMNKGDDGLNNSLKQIKFVTGGNIRIISAHNPDRLRGSNDKLFGLSEFQAMDPMVIDIIMPILEANGGVLLINMTANGDSAAKVLLEAWRKDPSVYVSELSAHDTPVFDAEQLDRILRDTIVRFEARGQSEEEAVAFFSQEYLCSWDSPVIGSYFGAAMRRADQENRITKVPHEAALPVYTYWDLGMDDSMSIWFVQMVNRELRVIDYYENSGEGLAFYARMLKGNLEGYERMKYYDYGQDFAPHDIEVRELGTGVSRKDTAKKLGINFKTVQRPARKQDGIDAIRNILSRCWFDETNCRRGISALKGYKKEWNEKMMVYGDRPVHDWTSHGTDAFQTFALSNPQPMTGDTGGRIVRTAQRGKMPPMIVHPDGKMAIPLDFKRAYAPKRRTLR